MKKPREFWILTMDGMTLPGVVDNKDVAEQSVMLTHRSNAPGYIHVREVLPESEAGPEPEGIICPSCDGNGMLSDHTNCKKCKGGFQPGEKK
jgi:hypothetical protein